MSVPGLCRPIAAAVLALAALAASPLGHACSPPPIVQEAGFVRAHVERLPKNAKGVMFAPAPGALRASDFRVESKEDGGPLALRIRRIRNSHWVRIEPVEGFRPGARYLFRYLPAHQPWRHADSHAVAIDDAAAGTAGRYAIEPALHAVNRVLMVPTSAGSCTKPAPVVLHAFSHAVPGGLSPYRHALQYEVHHLSFASPGLNRKDPRVEEWGPASGPSLRGWMVRSLAQPLGPHDAVIAPCGNRWNRVRLRSTVSFPELDDRRHITREVALDLSRGAGGECGELEALLQTMAAGSPEAVLREVCLSSLGPDFTMGKVRLATIPLEDWERSLEFPFVEMAPSCNLAALAHLWRNGAQPPTPAYLDRIAAALERGYVIADAALRQQIVHSLAYLVGQLPDRHRPRVASRLLAPLLPSLVEALSVPHPRRPDELAQLIVASGALPPALRVRVVSVAAGKSAAAQSAKAILVALPR